MTSIIISTPFGTRAYVPPEVKAARANRARDAAIVEPSKDFETWANRCPYRIDDKLGPGECYYWNWNVDYCRKNICPLKARWRK